MWLESMFSGESEPGDVIPSRTLNITKITGLLVPIGTAIAALIEAQTKADGPLAGLTPGQKLILWLGVLAFILVIASVDMLVRGIATAASYKSGLSLLPPGLKGTYTGLDLNVACQVVASRSFNGDTSSNKGQFLVLYQANGANIARWVDATKVDVPQP
jgi:hypothetical protein